MILTACIRNSSLNNQLVLRPQGVKLREKITNDSDWCPLHDHIKHCQMIRTPSSKDDIQGMCV
jgi:hypothetical protein